MFGMFRRGLRAWAIDAVVFAEHQYTYIGQICQIDQHGDHSLSNIKYIVNYTIYY